MGLNVTLDSEIVAYGVGTAVCNDHGFALAINLITAVIQEVCHNHFGFLCNGVAMLLIILEQRTGGLTLDQLWVVLGYPNQLERFLDGGIVGKNIQNIMLLDGLPHGINMERCFDGFAVRISADFRSEILDGLVLRGGGKGKEGLVFVPSLTDDFVDIIIRQIHFIFRDTCFRSVFLGGNADID